MPLVKIYVTLKKDILDVQGATILRALNSLGYDNVDDVKIGKYILVDIDSRDDCREEVKKICDQLLTNPIIEDYTFEVSE